jgi:hypothetical protein
VEYVLAAPSAKNACANQKGVVPAGNACMVEWKTLKAKQTLVLGTTKATSVLFSIKKMPAGEKASVVAWNAGQKSVKRIVAGVSTQFATVRGKAGCLADCEQQNYIALRGLGAMLLSMWLQSYMLK